jgi:chromosome segregation and condensation protein ScpB
MEKGKWTKKEIDALINLSDQGLSILEIKGKLPKKRYKYDIEDQLGALKAEKMKKGS